MLSSCSQYLSTVPGVLMLHKLAANNFFSSHKKLKKYIYIYKIIDASCCTLVNACFFIFLHPKENLKRLLTEISKDEFKMHL